MVKKENIIILGSTGRNTGKTEFACRLIHRFSASHQVVGVKVVSIDKNEGNCPRGGKGCGVCSSLNGDFEIAQEQNHDSSKDTSRMLMAGADKVYMLKVDKDHLEKGIKALLEILPANAMVVMESNSIRKAIEPGLFLVIRNLHEKSMKRSCAEVAHLADKIIEFHDMNWDFEPERVAIHHNRWVLRHKATAILLAGGKSSRMGGGDKSLLPINGKPLIQNVVEQLEPWFDEIIIGANDMDKYKFLGKRIIQDKQRHLGPLMGIHSCLDASESDINFIAACDIPVMNLRLIGNMINLAAHFDIVMPVKGENKHEPLFAVYHKKIASDALKILNSNGRRIIELFNSNHVGFIPFDDDGWYQNLNYRNEYLKYLAKAAKERVCNR